MGGRVMLEERLQTGGWRLGGSERKKSLRQLSLRAGPAACKGMVEETWR